MKQRVFTVLLGAVLVLVLAGAALAASTNTTMPAYYDCQLFTINFQELPPGGEEANLAHNGSINFIYMSDDCPSFVSVLDAIQGDGFNPLWVEVQVHFPGGCPTTQEGLCSDDDIATAAMNGQITLEVTDEVYRCSVIGPKKK
jgi:hypothetical protein